jgi:ectoine hydroxylase-related dioxygenase (phytanoyl-CoA dioxygenase family)
MKAGVQNVQPPVVILENMLAVCVHLDDCHERNGALRVLPGTHCSGRLTAEQVELAQQAGSTVTCSVGRGGAVLLKPLTLHASSAAVEPSHRRVIHIDYAACPLPSGLAWFAGPNRHLYNSPK